MSLRVRGALAGVCIAAVGFAAGVPARAEDGFHPLDSALKFMNLKTDPGTMPDFVEANRPDKATTDYVPVGVKPPDRTLKVRTPAEVKAMTADLDAARAAQLAGKRPKPMASGVPAKPAAPDAAAKPAGKPLRLKTATDR